MSTPEDELKIDLDAPVEPKKAAEKKPVEKDAPADDPASDPDEGLTKLQKQLDDERNRRIAAEREAQDARNHEAAARGESHGDKINLLNTALENVKAKAATLRSEYAAAAAEGDWAKAAEVQELIGENSARKIQLESGKTILERQGKPAPRVPTDPVEAFVQPMTPKSAAWVRSHPEYVHDPKLTRKMIRAHDETIDDGIKEDTPEYFASIERILGIKKEPIKMLDDTRDGDADPTSEAAAPARRAAPAAAPVSRSGNGAGERSNTMRLTRDEVEAAQASGITPEEYAKNKLILKRDGRLN